MTEDETSVLWDRFRISIDLYKFHYDLAIRLSLFYYAITSAVLAYVLANPTSMIVWALLLPIFLSVVYIRLFFRSLGRLEKAREVLANQGKMLGEKNTPDLDIFKDFVLSLDIGFSLMAVFMAGLLVAIAFFGVAVAF